uniref:Uncharacterized protein n=1 Tax=Anguilla anguilla TaxID=7936 RepID=A0A0E9T7M2_ANGAN
MAPIPAMIMSTTHRKLLYLTAPSSFNKTSIL